MTRAYAMDAGGVAMPPSEVLLDASAVAEPSTPPAEPEKRRWRTPPWLFAALDSEFRFDLDACADADNTLCRYYLSASDDALDVMWHASFASIREDIIGRGGVIRTAWVNPPWGRVGKGFAGTGAFVDRAWEVSRRGLTVVVLVESATDTAWWKRAATRADEVRIAGRIAFARPDGTPGPQPPGGVTLFVFRPHVPELGHRAGPRIDPAWAAHALPGAPVSRRRRIS